MSSLSDPAADPEAQWPPPPPAPPGTPAPPAPPARTCLPLPWALVAALLILAATCAAWVARTWVMPAACASSGPSLGTATSRALNDELELRADPRDPLPQGQGIFAKLLAQNVLLRNGTLSWHSQPWLKGVYLSPGLSYDEDKQELVVTEDGVYYIFLQLELQRKANLQVRGQVSLALLLQPCGAGATALALTVDLPCSSEPRDSAGGFRGDLLHLGAGQRLSVRLSVHLHAGANAHNAWQLAQGATVLGLFRVTTKVPNELFQPLAK
ncbi:Tumor necrosis factor ligand superfamily member 9 [Sciurus carolinensis]|uniref:Tumor necrosis factor ligand superfamily member 9 n=1 Tax=Sciurus carolinensis TaxID=30640 RepID=A0AA41N8Y4_SCICA|nr:Tumor necrosis factor ligand superfamily member 9 [Sciurus carolinensis]